MTSRQSSKADGTAHAKLIKMVNYQRARCNLTTLDDVMNHTGFSWVESMLEHAKDLYQDYSTRIVSEADMNVNILRSPKKDKRKAKLPKKVTSYKKASPYKKMRQPKESTPPRKSPKKVSAASLQNITPESSTSTKVAQRDSISSRGTLVDRPLQFTNLDAPFKISENKEKEAQIEPVAVITNEIAPEAPMSSLEASKGEVKVVESDMPMESRKKRKSEVELEKGIRKRQSQERSASTIQFSSPHAAKQEEAIIIDDTLEEEEEVAVTKEKEETVVKSIEDITLEEDDEDSLSLAADEIDGGDSLEVSRVVTEKIDVDKAQKEENREPVTVDSSLEKGEIESVDSDLVAEEKEPRKGVKDLKAVITQLRNSMDDTRSTNDTKGARSDDVFSEGEAEAVPSSSSGTSVPKPSLRERIDRFRAIFSPAPRPAVSNIPRLSPPKYSQSPPRPQLSSIAKPIAKSVAVKPIESKSIVKPVVAKVVEKLEPKETPKAVVKVVEKPIEKVVEKPIEKVVKKSIEKSVTKPVDKVIAKPVVKIAEKRAEKEVEKPKETVADKPVAKTLTKIITPAPSIAPASPAKPPVKKTLDCVLPLGPASSKTPYASTSTHQHASVSASTAIVVKPVPTTTAPSLSVKVIAPVRGSSIRIAAPVSIRPSTQIKAVIAPVKIAPSQPAPAISLANPFQKAQQQQQQQVLATTTQLRTAKQIPQPIASTAHIELEEPDSAYSDSEDEETVRRRQQHKPWETREGLAKALEEQATIDADMIFGIPHGAVPIDEILPPENEHARAKRARPRSSSATWSRDGLKQIEIDRYNERMGIQGPGVLLPITVQDDGSGTPSRSHRLSAIAQSAVSQGQITKKPSFGALRGSVSPNRPTSVLATYTSNNLAPSTIKYPQLLNGTPNRVKPSMLHTASAQKTKASYKTATGTTISSSKQTSVSSTPNPFQSSSTVQSTSRLAAGPSKTNAIKK